MVSIHNTHYIRTMISQSKKWILEEAQREFGCGSVTKRTAKNIMIDGVQVRPERVCWYWNTTTNDSEKVLKELLPYLKIKKPQAELALQFQEFKRKTLKQGGRLKDGSYPQITKEIWDAREQFRTKMRELNKRCQYDK